MALDQVFAHYRVVGKKRARKQQHQVAAGGRPLPSQQLVGHKSQHSHAGQRDTGDLGTPQPFQACGVQDQEREDGTAGQDQRT